MAAARSRPVRRPRMSRVLELDVGAAPGPGVSASEGPAGGSKRQNRQSVHLLVFFCGIEDCIELFNIFLPTQNVTT